MLLSFRKPRRARISSRLWAITLGDGDMVWGVGEAYLPASFSTSLAPGQSLIYLGRSTPVLPYGIPRVLLLGFILRKIQPLW